MLAKPDFAVYPEAEETRAFGRAGLMRFRILGHLEVQAPDGWTAISAAKWRSLLACLLVRPGQLVPTETLIFELWGDNPPSTANNMVSIYVHRLRKEVIGDAEGRIARPPGARLPAARRPGRRGHPGVRVARRRGQVRAGRRTIRTAPPSCSARRSGCGAGRCWPTSRRPRLLATHVERATELWLDATELRVEADLACGRAAQVVAELRGLVADHPMRERLWALLMRALEEAGRRAEAFEAYAQARQVIADELGVEPGSELQRLYAELLAADASSAPPRPDAPQRPPPHRPAAGAGSATRAGAADRRR